MIRLQRSLLALALVPYMALAQEAGSNKTPTAGIDKSPRSVSSMSFSRTAGRDSVGVGGVMGIPGGAGRIVVAMPSSASPAPAPAPVPPAVAFDPAGYAASDAVNGAHDVAIASLEIYVRGDGGCVVRVGGSVNAGDQACGSFIPPSANLSDYQVRIVPSGMTAYVGCAASAGSAGYTPSADTGWLSFPAGGGGLVSISASAGPALGMSCPGSSAVYGAYVFQVRRVGDTGFTTSTVQVSVNADNVY